MVVVVTGGDDLIRKWHGAPTFAGAPLHSCCHEIRQAVSPSAVFASSLSLTGLS